MEQPGQADIRGMLAQGLAERFIQLDLRAVLLERLLGLLARPASLLRFLQRAAQQTTGQRAPRDEAQAERLAGRDDLELDHAGIQVVQALLGDQTEEVPAGRDAVGPGDVPAGEVAAADVDDLALADELLHRLPDLLPGRVPINVVHLIQVDDVGLQPAQAVLAGPLDVGSR